MEDSDSYQRSSVIIVQDDSAKVPSKCTGPLFQIVTGACMLYMVVVGVLNFRENDQDPFVAYRPSMLGKSNTKEAGGNKCTDFCGQLFRENGIHIPAPGGKEPGGRYELTYVSLPGESDGHGNYTAQYFLYADSVAFFGGVPYYELGTLHMDATAVFGETSNCDMFLESQALVGDQWSSDSNWFHLNTHDQGQTWLGAGYQDFGDGEQTAEIFTYTSVGPKECAHRLAVLKEAFTNQGFDLPDSMDARLLCHGN